MLPLPWVVWWGRQRDTNVTLEGVVEDRKHGSCYKKEEQKKGGEERARGGGADNKPTTLSFIKLSCCCVGCFPAPAFTARACTKQHQTSIINPNQLAPYPPPSPPFYLVVIIDWIWRIFFSPRLPLNQFPLLEDVFGSIRVQKPQTLPPVAGKPLQWFVCCQSALQTVMWERAKERERRRDERGTLAGERGRKRWRRKYTTCTSTPAPFFFHALSPYKHTLHCGARLTCFDTPSSLSLSFLFLSFSFWD